MDSDREEVELYILGMNMNRVHQPWFANEKGEQPADSPN